MWVVPFVMAAINTRNVPRSNIRLGHPSRTDVVDAEMPITGSGDKGRAIAEAVPADKSLASDDGPKPGAGPSQAERKAGFYDLPFIAGEPGSAGPDSARADASGRAPHAVCRAWTTQTPLRPPMPARPMPRARARCVAA